jgi:hypothetical protein
MKVQENQTSRAVSFLKIGQEWEGVIHGMGT